LISRLAYVQLVKGDEFVALVQRTETTTSKKAVPRGSIYDSQGRVLVGNKPKLSINYTRPADAKASKMLEIAKKLTSLISVDTSELKERDLKDYCSIRINNQWRIQFKFQNNEAYEVKITDYH